jgi:hypothetical protein
MPVEDVRPVRGSILKAICRRIAMPQVSGGKMSTTNVFCCCCCCRTSHELISLDFSLFFFVLLCSSLFSLFFLKAVSVGIANMCGAAVAVGWSTTTAHKATTAATM